MKFEYKFNAVNIIRMGLIVFALIRIVTFVVYKGGYSEKEWKELEEERKEGLEAEEEEEKMADWEFMEEKGREAYEKKNDEIRKKNQEIKNRNQEIKKKNDEIWDKNVKKQEQLDECRASNSNSESAAGNVETFYEIQPSLWPTTILVVPYMAIVVLISMKKDISPVMCLLNVMSILLLIYAGITCFLFSWKCRKIPYLVIFELVFFIEIALNCAIIVLEVIRVKKDIGTKTAAPTVASTMAPATAPPTAPAVPATASAMAPADANGGPATAPAAPPV